MKRRRQTSRRGRFLIGALVCMFSVAPLTTHAIQLRSETNFFVGAEERLEEELWLLAGEVIIEGAAADDLLILSRTFELGGTAEGDVWAAAEKVVFRGTAHQQVRIVAQNLTVGGRIDRSLAAAAPTMQVMSNAVIGGDVLLAADTATIGGTCERNLQVACQRFTLQGHVMGDVRVIADDIVLLPGAVVDGDFVYTSDQDVVPGKGVTIGGEFERRALPRQRVGFARRAIAALLHAMAAMLTGLVMLRLFPSAMGQGARLVRHAPGRCILVGTVAFLAFLVAAIVGVLVAVTRPLGLMAAGLLASLLYLGKISVAIVIGSALLRYRGVQGYPQALATLAAGVAVLYILLALPTIWFPVWLAASTLGLGAFVAAFMARSATPPPLPPGAQPASDEPDTNLDQENTEP